MRLTDVSPRRLEKTSAVNVLVFCQMYLNNTWYLNKRCRLIVALAEWVSVRSFLQEVRQDCKMMLLTLILKSLFYHMAFSETYSTLPFFFPQNFRNQTGVIASHCFHTSFKKADSSTDCALERVFVCFSYIWHLPWLVIVSITQFTIQWAIFEKIHLLQSMTGRIWTACAGT